MTNQKTISSLVNFYTAKLANPHYQHVKSDIQTIVCSVLGVDKTYLYMYGDRELEKNLIGQIDAKVTRYSKAEPLAYIVGYKYFWHQKLKVTPDTLIPRADTEVLVQSVLDDILNPNNSWRILDLGTGTGAIALALAGELHNAKVVAVDFALKALEVAKHNAIANNINNVEFIQSDWYQNLVDRKFDIIVANPPYIDKADSDIDTAVKAYEPASALFAGDDGLADIEKIVSQAANFLATKGRLYIEHGYTQAASVQSILAKYGFIGAETIQDLNGKDRCTKVTATFSKKG